MAQKDRVRCWWCGNEPLYVAYHDNEWGEPVHDDRVHFEFLILEGAQAGLSWSTILKRREGYRKAFAGFDPLRVARFSDKRVEKLLQDEGIIRNRLKIKSAINNARRFLEVQREFGSFDRYIWGFTGGKTLRAAGRITCETMRATSPESDALSKDLKKRGFSFVGSTIMYAYMQACGLVNDHEDRCFKAPKLARSRKEKGI
ncbi:MAG: DNA-3-methyladenine glycosylase I [Deltaproteobacteria bacterium]|nr:DNA-3-methyladenine glycosylase I [Deltaproteobacteria bacterium]